MAWDIYIYIIRVASLQQGEKIEIEKNRNRNRNSSRNTKQ